MSKTKHGGAVDGLDAIVAKLSKTLSDYYTQSSYLNGLVIITIDDLRETIKQLENYKEHLKADILEYDDNPNWRAANPDIYGVKR